MEEENFTLLRSRKKRDRKVHAVVSRPLTRSQKNIPVSSKNGGNSTLPPGRVTRRCKNTVIK
jgi:hypothetical protein